MCMLLVCMIRISSQRSSTELLWWSDVWRGGGRQCHVPHDNESASMRRPKEERPNLLSLCTDSLAKEDTTAIHQLDTIPNTNFHKSKFRFYRTQTLYTTVCTVPNVSVLPTPKSFIIQDPQFNPSLQCLPKSISF